MSEVVDLSERTVICHTEGCVNAGVPITFVCLPQVTCGPCGLTITDIVVT